MQNSATRTAALSILAILLLGACHSEEIGGAKFNEEASKQETIYKSQGEQRPSGYVIDRSLSSYAETLVPEFGILLAGLGPNDRWLDIGAGMGQAILDYFDPKYGASQPAGQRSHESKAQAVAISIEDRRTSDWHQTVARVGEKRMQYLFDKRLRDYSFAELGKFQIVTDVIGGFSYTEYLSLFVEKVLGFLVLNGSFFTVLQDVHSADGKNKPYYEGSPYLTEIANASGSEVRVCSWLKSITCVEVTCELRTEWKPPIEVYQIRKVCNEVTVPALELVHYAAGTPPERGFQLTR